MSLPHFTDKDPGGWRGPPGSHREVAAPPLSDFQHCSLSMASYLQNAKHRFRHYFDIQKFLGFCLHAVIFVVFAAFILKVSSLQMR